jgi:hypothetical protein
MGHDRFDAIPFLISTFCDVLVGGRKRRTTRSSLRSDGVQSRPHVGGFVVIVPICLKKAERRAHAPAFARLDPLWFSPTGISGHMARAEMASDARIVDFDRVAGGTRERETFGSRAGNGDPFAAAIHIPGTSLIEHHAFGRWSQSRSSFMKTGDFAALRAGGAVDRTSGGINDLVRPPSP